MKGAKEGGIYFSKEPFESAVGGRNRTKEASGDPKPQVASGIKKRKALLLSSPVSHVQLSYSLSRFLAPHSE